MFCRATRETHILVVFSHLYAKKLAKKHLFFSLSSRFFGFSNKIKIKRIIFALANKSE
jgi:hypothetical protein